MLSVFVIHYVDSNRYLDSVSLSSTYVCKWTVWQILYTFVHETDRMSKIRWNINGFTIELENYTHAFIIDFILCYYFCCTFTITRSLRYIYQASPCKIPSTFNMLLEIHCRFHISNRDDVSFFSIILSYKYLLTPT